MNISQEFPIFFWFFSDLPMMWHIPVFNKATVTKYIHGKKIEMKDGGYR